MTLEIKNHPDPRPIGRGADEQLRVIRSAMERAGSFTAVPGWGGFGMGLIALGTAAFAHRYYGEPAWLGFWLLGASLAFALGTVTIARKARRFGIPIIGGVSRRFYLTLGAPLVAGALVTASLALRGTLEALPGIWLVLYGAAVLSAGATSIPIIPTLGFSFMAVGAVALCSPSAWGDAFMAFGFGGLQIVYGLVIARRHGG